MKSEDTKELIMNQTIQLINELNGDVAEITIRKIAQRANIGVGLIHHYFKSKDQLIEVCVQRIIHNVVYYFRVEGFDELEPLQRTKLVATQVVKFLMENQSISKISILDEMKEPKEKDNTVGTAIGLAYCMASDGKTYLNYLKKAFVLVSILQVSFLRRNRLSEEMGIDFYEENQRNEYINSMVDMVMGE